MIVVMQPGATPEQVRDVEERLRQFGFDIHPIYGVERTVIAAVGAPELDRNEAKEQLESLPWVEQVTLVLKPYKFVSKKFRERTIVEVNGLPIGGELFVVMAGPCTVESEEQLLKTAQAVHQAGAHMRAGHPTVAQRHKRRHAKHQILDRVEAQHNHCLLHRADGARQPVISGVRQM